MKKDSFGPLRDNTMRRRVLLSLLLCLLVLPHHATAASIPIVITFDQQEHHGVLEPMPPLVFHATLSLDNGVVSTHYYGTINSPADWLRADFHGDVSFGGVSFPLLPPPVGLDPLDSENAGGSAYEIRQSPTHGGRQVAGASWGHGAFYGPEYVGDELVPRWFFGEEIAIQSDRRQTFMGDMDMGTPSVQSVLDTLAWGGWARMSAGWNYGTGLGSDHENIIGGYGGFNYQGTYALDTTAVPEPASLLLLASGLVLFRLRR